MPRNPTGSLACYILGQACQGRLGMRGQGNLDTVRGDFSVLEAIDFM
jgi:hypothetical protein